MIRIKRIMLILIIQPHIVNPYPQGWSTAKHRHMIEITQHVRKIGVIKRTGSNLLIKLLPPIVRKKTTAGIVNGRVPTNRNTAITPSHRPNFRQRRIDIITPVIRLLFIIRTFRFILIDCPPLSPAAERYFAMATLSTSPREEKINTIIHHISPSPD